MFDRTPSFEGSSFEDSLRPAGWGIALSLAPLEQRMKKTYFEKLRDPRWQKKRLEAMSAVDFSCEMCGDCESTLNVHHKQYFKGREPWEYDIGQLVTLCESCHKEHHASEDSYNFVGSYLPLDGPGCRREAAVLVLGALLNADMDHEFVQRLFPDPWPYLPTALAIGRTALAIEGAIAWKLEDLPEILDFAEAIDADPKGFKNFVRQFVQSRRSRSATE